MFGKSSVVIENRSKITYCNDSILLMEWVLTGLGIKGTVIFGETSDTQQYLLTENVNLIKSYYHFYDFLCDNPIFQLSVFGKVWKFNMAYFIRSLIKESSLDLQSLDDFSRCQFIVSLLMVINGYIKINIKEIKVVTNTNVFFHDVELGIIFNTVKEEIKNVYVNQAFDNIHIGYTQKDVNIDWTIHENELGKVDPTVKKLFQLMMNKLFDRRDITIIMNNINSVVRNDFTIEWYIENYDNIYQILLHNVFIKIRSGIRYNNINIRNVFLKLGVGFDLFTSEQLTHITQLDRYVRNDYIGTFQSFVKTHCDKIDLMVKKPTRVRVSSKKEDVTETKTTFFYRFIKRISKVVLPDNRIEAYHHYIKSDDAWISYKKSKNIVLSFPDLRNECKILRRRIITPNVPCMNTCDDGFEDFEKEVKSYLETSGKILSCSIKELWTWCMNEEDYYDMLSVNKIDHFTTIFPKRHHEFIVLQRLYETENSNVVSIPMFSNSIGNSELVSNTIDYYEQFGINMTKETYYKFMVENCNIDHEKIANIISEKIPSMNFNEVKTFWGHICNLHYASAGLSTRIII